jgi:hypothetical protein
MKYITVLQHPTTKQRVTYYLNYMWATQIDIQEKLKAGWTEVILKETPRIERG